MCLIVSVADAAAAAPPPGAAAAAAASGAAGVGLPSVTTARARLASSHTPRPVVGETW